MFLSEVWLGEGVFFKYLYNFRLDLSAYRLNILKQIPQPEISCPHKVCEKLDFIKIAKIASTNKLWKNESTQNLKQ